MSELQVVREFRAELIGAPRPARRRGRPVAIALAGLVAVTGIATAATGEFPVGDPLPPWGHGDPTGHIGAPEPATDHLLAVRTADPAGGPPWGLRAFATSSGWQCRQVGRVVDGRLGAIGRDGRFHAFPFEAPTACAGNSPLSGARQRRRHAAAAPPPHGLEGFGSIAGARSSGIVGDCPPDLAPAVRADVCGAGEPRYLFFGGASPDVDRVEIVSGGRAMAYPVAGGQFLIVLATEPAPGAEVQVVFRDGHREPAPGVVLRP